MLKVFVKKSAKWKGFVKKLGGCHIIVSASHSVIMGGVNLNLCQNFVGKIFFLRFMAEKTSMGKFKLYGASNTQKSKVFLLVTCYLPIFSNLLKTSLRKASPFVLLELLPTGLLKGTPVQIRKSANIFVFV